MVASATAHQPYCSPGSVTPFRPRTPAPVQEAGPHPLQSDRRDPTQKRDNLPLQLTRFIGRERELAQARELLNTERLVTLAGCGGVGKTRLALELAAEVRQAYPDGVWLVELESLEEPRLVCQAVATPLGVRAEGQSPLHDVLVDFLRARRLLLVLDNCEHLIYACAELVGALLRACPGLQILATSREPLRIVGETIWRVPTLSLPTGASTDLPESPVDSESVRLFADRAAAVSGFVVTDHNAAAVARVCQRLDGIPLAIELAAVRTSVLSVEEIAGKLDDRFRLLVGRGRTTAARQHTLRDTIDWSYDLLSAAEQDLLCRVSVFAGSWTLDAAERVCGGNGIASTDVLDLLSALVDRSLVLAEADADGRTRYRLLESVRHYAHDRLCEAQNATDVFQHRHCAYFCALAKDVENHILWDAEEIDWRSRLDSEQANLRAALRWSLSDAGDAESGLKLVGLLGHFWYTRGDRCEGRAWLRQALTVAAGAGQSGDASARSAWAWAMLWGGGLAHGQSHYGEAVELLQQALHAFEQLDDKRGIGWALGFLGYVARARADLAEAKEFLDRAVAVLREIRDELSLILPLAALGFTTAALGDGHRAMLLLEESIALARKSNARGRLAMVSVYLGQARYAQGDLPRAMAAFEDGLKLSRAWGSAWGMAECLEGLSLIAGSNGHARRAACLFGAAARLREPISAAVHPIDRADHDQVVARIQSAIGHAAFDVESAAGKHMTLEQIIDYALAPDRESPRTPLERGSSEAEAGRLTVREREVAVLIAAGMSNRQIAQQLVVAVRTATNHVEHILDKLGFHSRTQVAAWVTEHRLAVAMQ